MKLARFNENRIGIVNGDRIVDVTEVCGIDAGEWPPVGMNRVIASFAQLRPRLAAAENQPGVPLHSVQLEAPIAWPRNLLALPNNFADHSAEMSGRSYAVGGNLAANLAGFFMKAPSSLVGPQDAIVLPDVPGREFHYECELATIIGKRASNVPAAEAYDYIFGYACFIDVTMRGLEERVMRKSFSSFAPMGPWITTSDEVGATDDIQLQLWVNGERRQHAYARDMILGIAESVELASTVMTLEPGDIIASGTMAGVGPLSAGDSVRIEIDRVGSMTIPVKLGAPMPRFERLPDPAPAG
jgi:2-keto-4-pentenoate hydratase/2-oxohepta-3-ene-1,7-dioic acid hydratase in catechol pathway